MSLIKCPECGREVSDVANTCIHCGFPLKNESILSDALVENTLKKVVLQRNPSNKLVAIKVVRQVTGLGPAQAKALVESSNPVVVNNIDSDRANDIANMFNREGITAKVINANEELTVDEVNNNLVSEPKKETKSVGRNIAKGCGISVIVFTLIIGLIVVLALSSPESEQPNTGTESNQTNIDTIEIPDIVGMDYETAREKLKDIDVEVTVDYTYSNTLKTNCNKPQDVVVTQSLQGKVEKGNKMIIVVAKPAISVEQINLDINYVGGVDTTIDFTNKSDKQIAYVFFNVKYYDRMGNLAFCSIKNSPDARLQFTGPLDASQKDDAYWEAVIYDSSVAAIQPQTIEIKFTDGTSQTIKNSGVYWHTSSYYGGDLRN